MHAKTSHASAQYLSFSIQLITTTATSVCCSFRWLFNHTIERLNEQLTIWQLFQAEVAACSYKELRSTAQLLTLLHKQQRLKNDAYHFIISTGQLRPRHEYSTDQQRQYIVKMAEFCVCLQRLSSYFAKLYQGLHLHALMARELSAPSFQVLLEMSSNMKAVYDWADNQLRWNINIINDFPPADRHSIMSAVQPVLESN